MELKSSTKPIDTAVRVLFEVHNQKFDIKYVTGASSSPYLQLLHLGSP
jgi:hypothetical protein